MIDRKARGYNGYSRGPKRHKTNLIQLRFIQSLHNNRIQIQVPTDYKPGDSVNIK